MCLWTTYNLQPQIKRIFLKHHSMWSNQKTWETHTKAKTWKMAPELKALLLLERTGVWFHNHLDSIFSDLTGSSGQPSKFICTHAYIYTEMTSSAGRVSLCCTTLQCACMCLYVQFNITFKSVCASSHFTLNYEHLLHVTVFVIIKYPIIWIYIRLLQVPSLISTLPGLTR